MRHDMRHDDWTAPSEASVEPEPEPAAPSPLAVEEDAEPAEELSPRMEAALIQPESPLTETFAAAAAEEEPPAWERLERRYEETIASLEPHSGWMPDVWELHEPETGTLPEAPPVEPDAGGGEAQTIDGASEPFTVSPEPAEEMKPTNAAEPPREAAVRERPANPRYQRRQRWAARRQPRGEEARPPRARSSEREAPKPLIGDLLKEGQEIIVQVAKEPLGKKGARITSHIALPGRYLVYMPTLNHVGVSRKIASDEERHRLKRIIAELTRNLPGGFIVRTAGVEHTEEKFRQDIEFLVNLWAEIKAKAEKSSAPVLLHHDLDVVLRTLRDQLSDEFATIWVDNEQTYEEIVSLVQRFQPALVNRVRLYTKDIPLFEETGVQEEINRALRPKVWLKSGGYIVINQTEALVAIDVNTGKFVGKSNRLEDTIVKTNVEAIQEIVRQIRLRDLGGIIVIDFIDMDERRNRQKVMSTLEEAMKADRAPSKSLAFNEFGLVAITRKRVRQSLERTLCQPCAYCSGSGLVKSPATICLEILAEARKMASEIARKQVTLRVNPEVGKALKARENAVLAALEELTGRGVIIRSDPAVHVENFYFD
jgi:ribonuclease G